MLNPARLKDTDLKARFALPSFDATVNLGRDFGKVLLPLEMQSVGFIAPILTGKSTLARGIYESLGAEYNSFAMAMVAVNGLHNANGTDGALIRHFDLAVQPEDEEDNFPSHWRALDKALDRPGIDLVEHAMKFREERFSYIFKLTTEEDGTRTANFYCDDAATSRAEVQDFINRNAAPDNSL